MKAAHKQAIDHLLRNIGARAEESARENLSGEHLDADELNSYAEGVLPQATHARFTTHLADCRQCRRFVSDLTASAGVRAPEGIATNKVTSSVWEKLGLLFSLPVLRYAMPAIILTALIAISFIVLQQRRGLDYVARNETSNASPENLLSDRNNEPATTQNAEGIVERNKESKKAEIHQKESEANTPAAGVGADQDDAGWRSDGKEDRLAKAAPAIAQPSYAPEPSAAAPPPQPRTAVSEESVKEQDRVQPGSVAGGNRNEALAQSKDEADAGPVTVGSVQRAPSDRRNTQGLAAGREAKRTNEKMRSEVNEQTRTVAGRHFRRQGNAWVDTTYDSSRPTVNMTRGSEPFEELVKDEPEIRRITEQLGGEVIVVWKGRAYRIR